MEALAPLSLPLDVMRAPDPTLATRNGKALQELEGLFLHLLVKEMRKSVPANGLFGESPAQKMFQEMLDEVYAQQMAESGQFGVAKLIQQQIDLQGKQREIRDALLDSAKKPEFLLLNPESPAASVFDLPQPNKAQEFIPLKSRRGSADMFTVGPNHGS